MSPSRKIIIGIALAICGAILLPVIAVLIMFVSMTSVVMTKRSPDGRHIAKLTRTDGIDRNFWVAVDGRSVYGSPDFAPGKLDNREQIVWSKDGDKVVLFVAGERMFGHSVAERRTLTDSELSQVQFASMKELGFEGEVPGKGQPE